MMSFIANAGAVPLGYVNAMNDGQGQCQRCCELYSRGDEILLLQQIQRINATSPLPDVIMSNRPFASTNHRSVSSSVNSKRTSHTSNRRSKSLDSSRRFETPRAELKSSPVQCSDQDVPQQKEEYLGQMTHTRKVQRTDDIAQESCSRFLGLPQLPRHIPPCIFHHQVITSRQRPTSSTIYEMDTHETHNIYYSVGKDLKKIADHFQLDHGKVSKKSKKVTPVLSVILPENFTQCVTASVLCLIWWRLLNKLR